MLAVLLALSATVAVGVVLGLTLLVGEWWVALAIVGAALAAWTLVAVATYERAGRPGGRGGAGRPGAAPLFTGRPPGAPPRRSRIA